MFKPLANVIPQTGPQSRSDEKFAKSTKKIPRADGIVPKSLTVAESYRFKLFSQRRKANCVLPPPI